MIIYTYTVAGTAKNNQTWEVKGEVEVEPGDFVSGMHQALETSFQRITLGRATYGNPGVGGCRGPYKVTQFHMDVKPHG